MTYKYSKSLCSMTYCETNVTLYVEIELKVNYYKYKTVGKLNLI